MTRTDSEMTDFLYTRLADRFERMVRTGVLKTGDKLPSIRSISKQEGVSLTTAYQAYVELEGRGYIEARPKSGYYIRKLPYHQLSAPRKMHPGDDQPIRNPDGLIQRVYQDMGNKDILPLSMNLPHADLMPLAKLKTSGLKVLRHKITESAEIADIQGIFDLRKEIAKISYRSGIETDSGDIIITAGCMEAMSFAIQATTEPGDTIAIESPTYFGIFQAIEGLGRKVVEVCTDPETGICIPELEQTIREKDIKACVLVSNFSNPMAAVIPTGNKKYIVDLLDKNDIVLIENDVYGEMYYHDARPDTLRAYDQKSNVILCSSFSKTVAPGFRIGWILAGRHYDKILKAKLVQSISTSSLNQEIMADFLHHGRYDLHMSKLRKKLHVQSMSYMGAIQQYFPENIRITQPKGAFVYWLELEKHINTIDLFNELIKEGISIAPGQMFSKQANFTNFFRLSYSMPYSEVIERALKRIGEAIADYH